MYQIAFPPLLLASFLPWLMLNRDGLSILLHPGTGDPYADHINHAGWLGRVVPLRMNVLRKSEQVVASLKFFRRVWFRMAAPGSRSSSIGILVYD